MKPARLLYLDGLRGLAALYVVLHHAYMEVIAETPLARLPFLAQHLTNWLGYGPISVDVFIVLSGYCLMLPAARSGGRLRGGTLLYLRRRACRILPPYYIALLLSLLLIALIPGMNRIGGVRWDVALPAMNFPVIVSHVLLVHNFNTHWIRAIDPPLWSVATEWQIYFLFPLALLPVWRRFGSRATVAAAFFVGLTPHFLWHRGDFACPWFLGLFALGMAAASVSVRSPWPSAQRIKYSVRACSLALFVFGGATLTVANWLWAHFFVADMLAGLVTACFLVFCTEHCQQSERPHPLALRLAQAPFAVFVGSFSYSLYLVHFPLLSLLHLWLRPLALPAVLLLFLLLSGGVLGCGLAAYLFHRLFERRFMPGSPQQAAHAEEAAAISPAP